MTGFLFFMQVVGLEPTRCCHRQILSLMRLPFRHTCVCCFLLFRTKFGISIPPHLQRHKYYHNKK